MKNNVLAICDEQVVYADFLTKQWLRMEESLFQICRFTTEEQLLAFARETKITCLLLSEGYEKLAERVEAKSYFCLTNERRDLEGVISNKSEPMHYIYRYQSIETIYTMVKQSECKEISQDTGEMKIIGVYNPVHRNGQTLFTKAMSEYYGKAGKHVLYLNLEEYSGWNIGDSGESLGEVIYQLKKEPKDLNYRLATLVKKENNYEYIDPMEISCELKKVTEVEWLALLTSIRNGQGYHVLMLDLDSCIDGFLEILELCDVLYMPIRVSAGGEDKRNQFLDNLDRLNRSEVKDKIIYRVIPTFENESDACILYRMEEFIEEIEGM